MRAHGVKKMVYCSRRPDVSVFLFLFWVRGVEAKACSNVSTGSFRGLGMTKEVHC